MVKGYSIITDITILKQKCSDATASEAIEICQQLDIALSQSRRKGLGLSAIQIGIAKRVAIVRMPSLHLDLVNAYIEEKCEPFRFIQEGCLSFGFNLDTRRYRHIILNNNGQRASLDMLEACVVQHEVDHISGLTILDRKWKAR